MNKEYKPRKRSDFDPVAAVAAEMGTVPPHAQDIEEAVIGAMMIYEDGVYQAMEFLSEKSFFDPKMRLVFKAMTTLFNTRSGVDVVTVTEQLRKDGTLEEVGGAAALTSLTMKIGSAANMEYYIRLLQQKTIQRELIDACYHILKDAFDPGCNVGDLIKDSQSQIYQAAQGNLSRSYVHVADAVNRSMQVIEEMQGKDGVTSVPSGFPSLDEYTLGWQPGNLIIIGARPSVGKTAFALNMARNAAVDHGVPTAFFSLEMTDVELSNRLIAAESGIPSDKLKGRFKLGEEEWERLEKTMTRLVQAPLFIDETSSLDITEFKSKALRLKREQDIGIIFVDYLQLMEASVAASGGSATVQKITEISRQLKATAKELKIPIIALSQLNRNLLGRMGSNGRPILSDLKDSGSIEQDADLVLFVHRPGVLGLEDGPDAFNRAEIIIAKNRSGRLGTIDMTFSGDQQRFMEGVNAIDAYAPRPQKGGGKKQPADDSPWNRANGMVGEYDPFVL